MQRMLSWLFGVLLAAFTAGGCMLRQPGIVFDTDLSHFHTVAAGVEFPQAGELVTGQELEMPGPPNSIADGSLRPPPWDLTLEEAITIAITHSPVMRDLGGAIVRAPATVPTIHGPAIQSSDPRQGMEAALSAFDTSLATRLFFEKNNRMINNFFSAGGTNFLKQDYGTLQTELRKHSAGGTQFALRNSFVFDRNNAAGNALPQAYDSIFETEVRQPLLQGAGVAFNRIAGPNAVPGVINGVMVARLNTDISVLEFEMALRDLVSNVENVYWDLYFAYRDLDAKIAARDFSLDVWRRMEQQVRSGQAGGDPAREAQFREQYFRFQQDVQNSLTGRLLDGTTTYNGSSGGTFRGFGGVYVSERRLRMMLGLDVNDRRLIRPASSPSMSKVRYDWEASLTQAMTRRSEVRRQRLKLRQRELELIAAKNFLLPQLDLVARYRQRGLGRNLLGDYAGGGPPAVFEQSSLENLFDGDFQEWQWGAELTLPIGFRRAHAAVRNAQLQIAREHAVLVEQERRILHDLSNAISDTDRAYEISGTAYNRRMAAKEQIDILLSRQRTGTQPEPNHDQLIDAQRRFADADTQYHRALAEYMIAMKNVHYEKGTLLDYSQVHLAEPSGIGGDYAPRTNSGWFLGKRFNVPAEQLFFEPSESAVVVPTEEVPEPTPTAETIAPPVLFEPLEDGFTP